MITELRRNNKDNLYILNLLCGSESTQQTQDEGIRWSNSSRVMKGEEGAIHQQ